MSAAELAQEAVDVWSTNAAHWDKKITPEGNAFWKVLQEPCLRRFFTDHLKPGCRALDISTGNGLCARWLASHGATVLATDGAPEMVEIAKSHAPEGAGISFQKLDVADPADFAALLESPAASEGFDIVLMNMAIMDVATIDPLAEALPKLLKKNGVFVATLLHPVFYTARVRRNMEVRDDLPKREVKYTITLSGYLNVPPFQGWAHEDQPVLQYLFHRPIYELLGTFLKTGLVMDGIEEPSFTDENRQAKSAASIHNWNEFPPIFAFRMRRIH
ncbi:S-adenosyl-L-methionine-dependent methyltransferase [Thozetella sp. PMI_491]|nr:S-adenosyl-L-methionine-dependent methyltransferase [Thozetella sp. PMI_491]